MLSSIASTLDCPYAPFLWGPGKWDDKHTEALLDTESVLGGVLIEGFVLKAVNRDLFYYDGKPLMAKVVSDKFKEMHISVWKGKKADVVEGIIEGLKTEARWQKAVGALRDSGELTGSVKDIGGLFKQVQCDIEEEEAETIKDLLYKHYRKKILRGSTYGLAEWYKKTLGV